MSRERATTTPAIRHICPVRRLTHGPAHHFFGYYEKSPWDADDRLVLCGEVDINDRMPAPPEDRMRIGTIDTTDGDRLTLFGETGAWCFQQGCMLQWLPPEHRDWVIYNDREKDRFVSRLQNVQTGEKRQLDAPVYQLDPRGRYALTLNFARLAETRPGYG